MDHAPSPHWPSPQLLLTPTPADGPVLVTVTWRVPTGNAAAFTAAMQPVARSRRRTGALRWELYRDGGDPTRFVESYLVATWAEHLHQHERRQTGVDRRFDEEALRHADGPPEVHHLLPPS
jgi:quinol monooxygenase YgiN